MKTRHMMFAATCVMAIAAAGCLTVTRTQVETDTPGEYKTVVKYCFPGFHDYEFAGFMPMRSHCSKCGKYKAGITCLGF